MRTKAPLSLAILILAACTAEAAVQAVPPIEIEGDAVQGGLLHGRAPPGAALRLDGKPVPVAPDGGFVIGLDRDQAEAATVIATLADGRVLSEALRVRPRGWRVEHVNVARRPSSEEYRRIRARELERIDAARAIRSTSDGWR